MAVVDESRYKSNSYKSRVEEENKKEVQKVVKGTVRKHEKTTAEKIKDTYFNELLYEVLIPSAKEILDTVIISTKDIKRIFTFLAYFIYYFLFGKIRL